ncbi:MAG: hypothetical protein ACOYXB_00480 [Bacteroidota bacterium]
MKRIVLTILGSAGIASLACASWYLLLALISSLRAAPFTFEWHAMYDHFWLSFWSVLLAFLVMYLDEVITQMKVGKS